MKAMVLRELAGPLQLTEVPIPVPGPGEVRVRVRATGVGLTVVIMTANPGLVTSFPRIPGHEVAGDVVEIGPYATNVALGDRVACHFYLTCGACSSCRGGRETLCERFAGYLGMAADGGYAEYLVVPARNLCRIPEGVSYLDAAIGADARLLAAGVERAGASASMPCRSRSCAAGGYSARTSPTRSWRWSAPWAPTW